MKQYLDLCHRIINEGVWVDNERTGKRCLTLINHDLTYHVDKGEFPLVTTRKSFYKAAIAEMIGYIRGYTSAKQFRDLGTKTWDANANENQAWLNNPVRKGTDDCGFIYGAVATNFPKPDGGSVNLIQKVYDDLKAGKDDRGEIITFYHPAAFHLGCLRPCMYSHHFSVLGDTLYLNSTQRSCDVPLGLNFNMVQVYFLLAIMAQITGLKPGKAYHKIVNNHIYEDQLELMRDVQLKREPYASPILKINPEIKTLEDLQTWVTMEDFDIEGYEHHPAIQYPFSV
ncbi:thymidylate synthase [Alteromonadaceae bacterium M269]|nr:thymidylate synthase [Alteromonadaceae bacterium M269]